MSKKKEKEKICCVCLNESPGLVNLVDRDVDHVDYYTKLSSSIPEIEWQRSFQICTFCVDLLDTVYTFRKNCIKSDEVRRQQLPYEKPTKDVNSKSLRESSRSTREKRRTRKDRYSKDLVKVEITESDVVLTNDEQIDVKDEDEEDSETKIKNEEIKHETDIGNDTKTVPDFALSELYKDESEHSNYSDDNRGNNDDSDEEFDENKSLSELLKRHKRKRVSKRVVKKSSKHSSKKLKVQIPKREMSCQKCDFTSTSKLKLVEHCKEEHGMNETEIKPKKSVKLKQLKQKKVKVKGPPVIKEKKTAPKLICDQCPFTSMERPVLVEHCAVQHGMNAIDVKPYKCDKCPGKFTSYVNLYQHKKIHEDIRSKMCSYCGKGFITKSDLVTHEKRHLNKREYACDVCGKNFNTHKNLSTHKFIVHTDSSQWKHVCEVCHKRFPIKSNYDSHIKRHTGERNFECNLCQKKFTDKCVLQRHMKTHSNAREYKCSVCGKEYRDERAMKRHMARVHLIGVGEVKMPSRERKHQCHICTKAYYDKNKLTRHLYVHTGEKPFACNICNKAFNDRSYLKQHLIKSHGMENESINIAAITPRVNPLAALHYPSLGLNFGAPTLGSTSRLNTSINTSINSAMPMQQVQQV